MNKAHTTKNMRINIKEDSFGNRVESRTLLSSKWEGEDTPLMRKN